MYPYSIYLHIPFCTHRCGYCDFNTYAGIESLIPSYVTALCREIELSAEAAGRVLPVHSVFFGGGTPSLLPPAELERILRALQAGFEFLPGIEIPLEANPGTLPAGYLADLRRLGVTRLSLGVQSAHPGELRLLERQHSYADVIQAVTWARRAGFDNLNLDLIFGLPHQELETWQRTLDLVVDLHPEHFSLYALTLEHGTPLAHWAARGLLAEPDPDLAADMYEWAAQRLGEAGYGQYEISNWAQLLPGGDLIACRHNLQYWRNQPYLGLGAGAHGYAGGVRTANVLSPASYIQRFREGSTMPFPLTQATQNAQPVDRSTEIGETMMMGLRLTREGVNSLAFQNRFGQGLGEVFDQEIRELSEAGLLEWAGEDKTALRLTERGHLLGNQVFMRFI
ncbi:MAG TPA: radical SAM family heme chaperone HemW [Anaerolineales bacterium]